MIDDARAGRAPSASPRDRRARFAARAPWLLGLAALLGACEGTNLFEGTGSRTVGADRVPPVVEILEPDSGASLPLGDSLLVAVHVTDNAALASLRLEVVARRGDPDLGTETIVPRFQARTVELEAVRDTIVRRWLQPIPQETSSEQVLVIATAVDSAGLQSADTLALFLGAARIEIRSPSNGQQLQAGRELGIRLFASDPASRITRIELAFTGVVSGTMAWSFPTPPDSAVVDTVLLVPAGAEGTLQLVASAVNGRGVRSTSSAVIVTVQSGAAADTARPSVALSVSGAGRIELTDSVRVTVTAHDDNGGSGLARIGLSALAVNTARSDTAVIVLDTTFTVPRTGTVIREFRFPPFHVDQLALPDTVTLLLHAFAVDEAGNCAAAVAGTEQRLVCGAFGSAPVAAGVNGLRADLVVVAGRTVRLPTGGIIADATVDTIRNRLYLANFSNNKVDLLDLSTLAFSGQGVLVGSEPWGMFLNRQGDTLMVANSGGTNISFVHLATAVPTEDRNRRLRTPNAVLFDVERRLDDTGVERYTSAFHDFSDRPQFLVQDSTGRLLYSTVPTPANDNGTIRVVISDPVPAASDDQPEVRLLFTGGAIGTNTDRVSIAHIDSLRIHVAEVGDLIELFDHPPGYPNRPFSSGPQKIGDAIATMIALGSDIFATTGGWNPAEVGLSDTTFLAASGDRGRVAFGEGAVAPFARIMMWDAGQSTISGTVEVRDLVNNAAERVLGVGLNRDGSLGVARGTQAAYFFTPNLRLQGLFRGTLQAGGAGAALHPDHDSVDDPAPTGVAFVGTSNQTIQLIDTFHFFGIRELHIRDNIVGPLRTSRALPTDNAGLSCPGDPQCVVVKLYGVTGSGGVVIVDVRARDLQ